MKQIFQLSLLVFFCSNSFSQITNYKNEFGFKSDNDSYLAIRQDRYYTNGLFLSLRHAADQTKLKKTISKKIWEAEAGHQMYNPQTGYITNGRYVDRPFAAYLYAGGKINWFLKDEQVLRVSLQAGTVGPSAKGKEIQEVLHKSIGFYEVTGWRFQVKDEIGINAAFDYLRLIARTKKSNTDISFIGLVRAGNTFSTAGTGFLIRTGNLNSLSESASTNSRISNNSAIDSIPDKEFFFYAKPLINFIAYDATIQGGLFRSDKGPITYIPKRFVASQELGVMYAKRRWTFDFSVIFKTKEISSMLKSQQYGSASIYYRFN